MHEETNRAGHAGETGRGRASAVPARLAGWHGWAESQNEALRQAALRLDEAIGTFNRSGSSPELLGRLGEVGAGVVRYVAANAATDAWVGAIGTALLDLARSRLPGEAVHDAGNTAILAGGLVTTTDSRIAAQVEPRPPDRDRRLPAARQLADRVTGALVVDDRSALTQALEDVQALGDDPEAAAAFFERLGAGSTLAWIALEEAGAILGPVLAAASHRESCGPAFADALFADRVPATLAVLTAGGFGESFLAVAGDTWLLLGRDGDGSAEDRDAVVVMGALARDPDAALAFLLESSQGDADAALPQPRLAEVLVRYGHRLEGPGPVATALGEILTSAGAAASATEPYGGPFGDQTQAGVLLFDLAAMPGGMVPEALLPAVASVVAGHLDALLSGPLTGWQERVLRLALLDPRGRPEPRRLSLIAAGFARWRADSAPAEYQPSAAGNRLAWDRYLEHAGRLGGLLARVRKAGFDAVLGEALRGELAARGVDPAAGAARAELAFAEVAGA